MGERGLTDARLPKVTGADLAEVAQLAQDREARGVGRALEEQHVGIGLSAHR